MSSELLEQIFSAHGGLPRWRELAALKAHTRCGGLLLSARSDRLLRRCEIMMSTKEPWVVISPFRGGYGCVRPERVWMEHGPTWPRAKSGCTSANPHPVGLEGLLARGQAIWRYVCTPFLLARPDVLVEELSPWREGGECWRRLLVRMADSAGRTQLHLLYVDRRGFVRRHDCPMPGGQRLMTAHYCGRHRAFGGLLFATRRRVYLRLPGGEVTRFPPLGWIDIEDVEALEEAPDCD